MRHPLAAGTGKLNGRSEQLLGQFLREYPGSSEAAADVRIATKLAAYPWRLTPGQVGRFPARQLISVAGCMRVAHLRQVRHAACLSCGFPTCAGHV
jgi:aryl-alcohol dehydrogenase-like predicted oxidoreductase